VETEPKFWGSFS